MRITLLGTGTSQGVPIIGCSCEVCTSSLRENKRMRPSVLVEYAGRHIVIDTAPEFRLQMLQNNVPRLDALLITHAHADHVFGFDDIRRFCQMQKMAIPVYATSETLAMLQVLFGYAFDLRQENWAIPRVTAHKISGVFKLFGACITPLTVYHGDMPILGFRIGDFAYISDCSHIPDATLAVLQRLDLLVIDALRYKPHPTHFNVDTAVEVSKRLHPRKTLLTHLCHEVDHIALTKSLPPGIAPAYDGLSVEIPDPAIVHV